MTLINLVMVKHVKNFFKQEVKEVQQDVNNFFKEEVQEVQHLPRVPRQSLGSPPPWIGSMTAVSNSLIGPWRSDSRSRPRTASSGGLEV